MTKPKLFWLTNKDTFNSRGQDILNHLGLVIFAFALKSHLKLLIVVKVVFLARLLRPVTKN
jgi:hypothetical protein